MKSRNQWQAALDQVNSLGLPRHPDPPKNWDTLTAIAQILSETNCNARILDAGAELYSSLLPSLYTYGYRDLTGINLVFSRTLQRGPISYEHGDITRTRFPSCHFDAIACLSVVEHGVDLRKFFAEMARVLKPGGLLIVSTDFWQTPINTAGKSAFGVPIHVFTESELTAAVQMARECGFELALPTDLHCDEKTVRWEQYNLEYTFVVLAFRRSSSPVPASTVDSAFATIS